MSVQQSLYRAMGALAIAVSGPAMAATYYFADCSAGAVASCVSGSNSNPGTDPSLPKRDMSGIKIKGGDTYRFARGSAWAAAQWRIFAPDSTRAAPTTFEDYTPAWGAGAPMPLLLGASGTNVIWFLDGTTPVHDEGYVIRNLELRGPKDGTGKGLVLSNNVDFVLAENLLIRDFNLGVHVVPIVSLDLTGQSTSSNFTLKNSVIRDNAGQGFLGGGFDMLIDGNQFDNNGFGEAVRNHNLYVDGFTDRVVIRGNTLTNSALVDGQCAGTSLMAHGHHPRLVVEGNLVLESKSGGGCWGIVLDGNTTTSTTPQNFTGLVIRGNRVVLYGDSTTGIGCSSCPGAIIENNHVVRSGGTYSFFGIRWPTSTVYQAARGDTPNGQVIVRNNSVYIDTPSRSHAAIKAAADGSTDDMIVSNLVTFGPTSPQEARCFDTGGRAASTFKAFDFNFCGRPDGVATWSAMYTTLSAARSAGFDLNGQAGDPRLEAVPAAANGWTMRAKPDSAAVSNAHRTYSAPTDYSGKPRDDRPDIGSVELRSSVRRPAPPTQVGAR